MSPILTHRGISGMRAYIPLKRDAPSTPQMPDSKELKVEIARYLDRRYGMTYDYNKEIMVTVGGSEAIDIALRAMLDVGDEVIIHSQAMFHMCHVLCWQVAHL